MSFDKREYVRNKPEVDFPEGEIPSELIIKDLRMGGGQEAKLGNTVWVHYVGVTFSGGEEFDSSWNRNLPLEFRVGAGQVIRGWDEGLTGMRVGGRRRLEIPAEMAYGDRGVGTMIGPGEALIFVIDLLEVQQSPS